MLWTLGGLTGLSLAGLTLRRAVPAPDPVEAAGAAFDVQRINTLEFTASGAMFSVGQNFRSGEPWPRVAVTRYTASLNYETSSMRQDIVRVMGARMPRGGGVPFIGEQRQIQTVSGAYAWDESVLADPMALSLPATCCTPPEVGGTAPVTAPAPYSQPACMLMLWATPQGFVRAAEANRAQRRAVDGGTEVSFTIGGKYRMMGVIDARNDLTRVRTWVEQSIVGDMLVETEYSGYRDFGGVRFPTRIVQKQDGFPSLELTVSSVRANVPVDIMIPDEIRTAPPPSVTVSSRQLADGVFWLTGGTHHSVAVEMRDYIVLVDTPNGEPRARAVLAKAKALIPGKPIRYVVVTHHHWDHMGGIRSGIDDDATIVAHETNRALLERAATAPFTIAPDGLAASHKPLRLETVAAEKTITDGARTIALYTMAGFDHAGDMLLVYLPKERILAEADAYTPPESPTTPLIAPKALYAAALYANIQRLRLEVRTIVPLHGARTADVSEVARYANR
jgi:glyoxylase-like metal-dependent hydrolase (beta-lactamase superfamily II)